MQSIDWSTILGWLVSGLTGILVGGFTAWLSYKFARKQDELKSEQLKYEQLKQKLREELLKDIDNPDAIRKLLQQQNLRRMFPQEYSLVQLTNLTNALLSMLLEQMEQQPRQSDNNKDKI